MSEGQESNKQPEDYQSLPNPNGGIFYDDLGTECNFLVEKECLKYADYYPEPEEIKFGKKVILLALLTSVSLLGLAALIQTPKIAALIQETGINSVAAEELRDKQSAEAFKQVVWEETANGLP